MSERIEFIEPVCVVDLSGDWFVAYAVVDGWVEHSQGKHPAGALDAPSQARIEAEKRRTLAHLAAQAIADKVDEYQLGCFAIDRDGRQWRFEGCAWSSDGNKVVASNTFHEVLNPTFYLPRPVEKIELDGVTYTRRNGYWVLDHGQRANLHFACALDLIWEQKQRIAELEGRS